VGAHVPGLFIEVERVPREGETVLASSLREPPDGGKASNQAVAAARLGAPTVLVTVLGNDERGREARAFFAAQGIDTHWCFEVEGASDVGIVLLPPSRIPAIVSVLDRNKELNAETVEQASAAIRSAALVACTLEAPAEAALAAFRLARAAGARTLLNPAPADGIGDELLSLVDVLVPNEHEAAALVGRSAPPAELASALAAKLPSGAVIVTAGVLGAFLAADARPVRHVPAPKAASVDTTGAGDAFIGALAARLQAGATLEQATAFAVRAASLSVERAGTMLAFPTAEELTAAAVPGSIAHG
jgi:ribokinase